MKRTLAFVVLILLASTAFGQFSLDEIMSPAFPTALVSSADGSKIAWVFNEKGVRNIYVARAPQYDPEKLTDNKIDDGQELGIQFFAGDDIIFTKGGAPNSQGEMPNPLAIQTPLDRGIWRIDPKGSAKKITAGYGPRLSPDGKTLLYYFSGQIHTIPLDGSAEGKKLITARGSQHSAKFSPDGSKIAFISGRGDHSFLGIFYIKENKLEFPDPSVDHDDDPVWSDDGKRIAFVRMPNVRNRLIFAPDREGHPWSIRVVNLETKEVKQIWRADPGRGSVLHDGVPALETRIFWVRDRILFPWEKDGWVHYYSIDEKGGTPQLLTPGDGEVEQASLSADQKHLIYSSNIGDIDRRHIYRVPVGGGKAEAITKGTGIEWNAVQTSDGFAFLRSDAVTTAWVWHQPSAGAMRMVGESLFPKAFPRQQLVTPEAVMITATDGQKAPAQLFLPKNLKKGEKRPAVIFLHGGSRRQMLLGFNYGLYYHHAYSMNQYLASQGYVVLSLNFRSGIGYGLDFREALNYGATGASEFHDLRGAGEYLRTRADVDATRIGLWGGSYGGYLTALGLTRAGDIFSCGVDIHGVHDWNVVVKNFIPTYDPDRHKAFAEKAYESSPMNYIKNWKAPVLLIHGDDDRNVPFSETVSLAEKLREQNVEFEQLIFPDEVHSFLLHESWVRAYKASAKFFENQFMKKPGGPQTTAER